MSDLVQSLKNEFLNSCWILSGSILIAVGVVLFLAPNQVATGGAPGMAILLNHLFPSLSLGTLLLGVNIPLLLIGAKYLGKSFALRTVVTILLVSLFIDFLKIIVKLDPISNDLLLVTLFGGVIIGIGVGFILRGNSSAGGSTIIARILQNLLGIKPGHTILAIDALIILSSAFVFNGIEQSLWSLISIYATSRCIDLVITGGPSEKVVHIVTNRVEHLSQILKEEIGPNGTILCGAGLLKEQEKTMIFLVVETSRLTQLRTIIKSNDPDAFMVVMDASEMLGRGH